jgi:hypothetical protein
LSDGECAPEPVQIFEMRSVMTTYAGDVSQDDEISTGWLLLLSHHTDTSRARKNLLREHYRSFTGGMGNFSQPTCDIKGV